MPAWLRWSFGILLGTFIVAGPFTYYRMAYAHAKRLRVVTDDRFLRSGQLNAQGFKDAYARYKFKTVINLQEENPDPKLSNSIFSKPHTTEKALLESMGVRYVHLPFVDFPDEPRDIGKQWKVLQKYIDILDDPTSYPVLLHCKAGLHRTGILTGIYRMEYEGWDKAAAVREIRANGFGDVNCHEQDENVKILDNYIPRKHIEAVPVGRGPRS